MADGSGLNYWSGLLSGFTEKREAQLARNLEEDRQRRALESNVFNYLLQSNDPEMRALALSGLFETAQPGRKKSGLAGYLGEIQSGQIYPQVLSRMNEFVLEEEKPAARIPRPQLGGPAPPRPASAAMPTNQPVRLGSRPISLPASAYAPGGAAPSGAALTGEAPPTEEAWAQGRDPFAEMILPPPVADPDLNLPQPPAALAPPPPPPSRWRRRGTGVPTAEEIAEMQARVPLETRIGMAQQYLGEDDARRAILGILGAPQTSRQFQLPTFAVEDPASGTPVPVSFDTTTGRFYFTDGTEVPRGAKFVRMAGGSTGSLTSRIPDTPEGRQYLLGQGADPVEVAGGSPTGYWKIVTRTDGSISVQPDIFVPPPAYSGTAAVLDAAGNPVVLGVPRGGVPGGVIGAGVSPQPSTEQASAQALLADVQKRVAAAETPRLPGMPRRPLLPAQRDQIVREAATAAGLPYQTYFELEQASRIPTARQVAPRPNAPAAAGPTQQPPVSAADRIRQRALQIQQGLPQGTAPPMGAPPPPRTPIRGQGPGPRR